MLLVAFTLDIAELALIIFVLLLLTLCLTLLCTLRRLFLLLLLNLFPKPISFRLSLPSEVCLKLEKLFAFHVHAHHAFQQLDLSRPNALVFFVFSFLVFDQLSVRVANFDRCFEHERQAREARVVDNVVKGSEAEEASANVGMEVAMRGEWSFAVVHVQGPEVLDTYGAFELFHGCRKGLGRAKVVAASESVAGIETDSDTSLVVDQCDCVAKVFERAAQNIATSRHVLKQRDYCRRFGMRAIYVARKMSNRLGFIAVCRVCHARVEVIELDAESFASFEVIDKCIVGLRRAGRISVRKID